MKQLTQAVFDLPECPEWANWAAVDLDSQLWAYRQEPQIVFDDERWHTINRTPVLIGKGYDNTDWQNSVINRA